MAELSASNALLVEFTVEDVKSAVTDLLKSKQWSTKTMDLSPTLVYIPHYVFHYAAYNEESADGESDLDEEEETESKGKKNSPSKSLVTDISHGTYSIDAASGELETDLGEYFEDADFGPFAESGEDDAFEREVQKPKLSIKEAERLAQLKTAKELSIPKNNVEITSTRLVYFPLWRVSVAIPAGSFDLDFSAVDGELVSEDEIPERYKGKGELATETVNELTNPSKWVEYVGNLLRDIYESEQLRGVGKFFLYDKNGRIILILFFLVLVLIYLGFIRL